MLSCAGSAPGQEPVDARDGARLPGAQLKVGLQWDYLSPLVRLDDEQNREGTRVRSRDRDIQGPGSGFVGPG